jgi:ankyrin repeat protein
MEIDSMPLFQAIKKGDLPAVEEILKRQPDIAGIADAGGMSAVLTALYYSQPAIADALINAGAPLNLFEASAAGRIDQVREYLSKAPRQVNAWSADGFQPLGLASFFGHTALAAYLLENGAEVNSSSHNLLNVQPLHSAAAGDHVEIVRLLIEHGADVNARQGEDFSPLHSAAQNGSVEMIRILLKNGADMHAQDSQGRLPLDLAVESGHQEAARLLGEE